jgi:hypothetical protein
MKHVRIDNTGRRGWFVGNFEEAAYKTDAAEVIYYKQPAGRPGDHFHTVSVEIVLIVDGSIRCQGQTFINGDIIILEPGEINDMEYLVDTTLVGVKTPAKDDKKVLI